MGRKTSNLLGAHRPREKHGAVVQGLDSWCPDLYGAVFRDRICAVGQELMVIGGA